MPFLSRTFSTIAAAQLRDPGGRRVARLVALEGRAHRLLHGLGRVHPRLAALEAPDLLPGGEQLHHAVADADDLREADGLEAARGPRKRRLGHARGLRRRSGGRGPSGSRGSCRGPAAGSRGAPRGVFVPVSARLFRIDTIAMMSRTDDEPHQGMAEIRTWQSSLYRRRWRHLQFLRDRLRLREEEEVVAAAGLGVGARHVEAAERVDADQRAGALAVEVEVADEELALAALELLAVARVDGAGQAVLGVVGDARAPRRSPRP